MNSEKRQDIAARGEQIYNERLKQLLGVKENKGKIVAIEVESGDYFMGDSVLKAGTKARLKYPGKIFYFKRIGYRAVHSFRSPTTSVKEQ
jgi:hypothetical protein